MFKHIDRTRAGALGVLVLFLVLVLSIVTTAYRALTDAFVAPMLLSPDNDVVLAHEQKVLDIEGQRQLLQDQVDKQRRAVAKMQKAYNARLVLQADLDLAVQQLKQAEINLIENTRSKMKTEASAIGDDNPRNYQVRLELAKVQATKRAKIAEQRVYNDKVKKLRSLEERLLGRPISQAIEHPLNAAFAPYSQISDIRPGGRVYSCVWGLMWCTQVGTVTEIVPGEVTMPDPWGNAARGQYVVLELEKPEAATQKVLRIRGEGKQPLQTASRDPK